MECASPPHSTDKPLVSSTKSTWPLRSVSNTSNRCASTNTMRGVMSAPDSSMMDRNTWSKPVREMVPCESTKRYAQHTSVTVGPPSPFQLQQLLP